MVISGPKVVGFIVKGQYLGRKLLYLSFRGHTCGDSGSIDLLEAISVSKLAGFAI